MRKFNSWDDSIYFYYDKEFAFAEKIIPFKKSYDILNIPIPQKSKFDYRYSYDTFIIWHNGKKAKGSVYTDRLYQWDYEKHNKLCKKYFGNESQYWSDRKQKDIEKFMQEFNDDETINVVALAETCNVSNGFPIWIIFYNNDNKPSKKANQFNQKRIIEV